ncbi:MAG: twin-arginine translocation pathway signal protein [Terriglobia bacterium]|nr:twin-arginine translocation pathway signal protein [Terriglobia bacterium]
MTKRLNRRSFLKKAGSTALGATAFTLSRPVLDAETESMVSFRSAWPRNITRPWPGPEFWANPLQDWRVHDGRLECVTAGGDRNVALLTREVAQRNGSLTLGVRLGQIGSGQLERGFVGFRVGIKSPMKDYRAAAIYGRGMNAGINADGRLFIGELVNSAPKVNLSDDLHLHLDAQPSESGYTIVLRATSIQGGHSAQATREVPTDWLAGGLALVCSSAPVEPTPVPQEPIKDFNFYPPHQHLGGTMRFWFADWTVAGSKVDKHHDRAYGPILFTLYTVSRGVLKLSAQFPPLEKTSSPATLQIRDENGEWKSIATAELDSDAWNATFRVPAWDATRERIYRVLYSMRDGSGGLRQYSHGGTIRKEPNDHDKDFVVGLLTCIWDFGFPHGDFTRNLAYHKPDILFWTGDQIYEPVGGYGLIESRASAALEPAMLDFLRKWFIFGWAVGDLTREIPSVCMTDDHDMYHGNIWGCGGRPTNPALGERGYEGQDSGGYKMPPRWVNMVQRVQTSHLPDPFDPTPVLQSISVYYTDLQWGGVSFAILEDRKWKSAPKEQLPGADIVNGFPLNPSWDPATQSNVPNAELLGQRQLDFLESWAADWSGGTWMKFAVTQTLFGCLHTEPKGIDTDKHDPEEAIPPVGVYLKEDHVVADHDSGAWPQHGRDAAIRKWRKGFAPHLSGDQHLGSTSHYGVEEFRDGVYAVCTPAISNIFPRRWFPPKPGVNALPGKPYTGDHLDAFGNQLTVLAVANPARYPGPGLEGLRYRVTGYTILACNRSTRKITITEWPRWVDPSKPGAKPYGGWPITIDQIDNGLRGAEWQLDLIETPGFRDPVVQVQDEASGEIIYTLRINGESFTPLVRNPGIYTVLAYDPDGFYHKEWKGLRAHKG